MYDIIRLYELSTPALSRTLRPLERAGWIHATPGIDRREVRWSLTPAGRKRLARAWPAWEGAQERLRARRRPEHWTLVIEDLAVVGAAAQWG